MAYADFLTLHGDLEQQSREIRLKKFREKTSRYILVATDVAARGLDIDDIDVVIQLGCNHLDSFVHRSGRTGRIGKNGLNVIFFERDDFKFIAGLEDALNIKVEIHGDLNDGEAEDNIEEKIIGEFAKKSVKRHTS